MASVPHFRLAGPVLLVLVTACEVPRSFTVGGTVTDQDGGALAGIDISCGFPGSQHLPIRVTSEAGDAGAARPPGRYTCANHVPSGLLPERGPTRVAVDYVDHRDAGTCGPLSLVLMVKADVELHTDVTLCCTGDCER